MLYVMMHFHHRTLNEKSLQEFRKRCKESRKWLLNATADIRRWNLEKYTVFIYSLHSPVEKLWHDLHVIYVLQLLQFTNVCVFYRSLHCFSTCSNFFSLRKQWLLKRNIEIRFKLSRIAVPVRHIFSGTHSMAAAL